MTILCAIYSFWYIDFCPFCPFTMHTRNKYKWGRVKMPRCISRKNKSLGALWLLWQLHVLLGCSAYFPNPLDDLRSSGEVECCVYLWLYLFFPLLVEWVWLWCYRDALWDVLGVWHIIGMGQLWPVDRLEGGLAVFPLNLVLLLLYLYLSLLLLRMFAKNICLLCQACCDKIEGCLDNQGSASFGMLFHPC